MNADVHMFVVANLLLKILVSLLQVTINQFLEYFLLRASLSAQPAKKLERTLGWSDLDDWSDGNIMDDIHSKLLLDMPSIM